MQGTASGHSRDTDAECEHTAWRGQPVATAGPQTLSVSIQHEGIAKSRSTEKLAHGCRVVWTTPHTLKSDTSHLAECDPVYIILVSKCGAQ